MSTGSYKLFYFQVRARAEVCRLSFAAANKEFEDIRLTGEEWAKEKACKYRESDIWRCVLARLVYPACTGAGTNHFILFV